MYVFKRIIKFITSYIYDIIVEKPPSAINIDIEVAYSCGKMVLNSKDLNYAYGSLHKAFQTEFKKLNFKNLQFDKVLILGCGVGSIASILKDEYKMDCHITGIEKDEVILKMGKKYFKSRQSNKNTLICADAIDFMHQNNQLYNLIIVDIYIGNDVPESCETESFISDIKRSLSSKGMLVFNKHFYNAKTKSSAEILVKKCNHILGPITIHKNNGFMIVFRSI